MSQDDIPFEGSIQETMLGPLWARAKYSQIYPELLDDQKAIEIIKNIKYDFSKIQEYLGEWRGLGLLARARNFDEALLQYIEKYPSVTVVNIGAGLDTTFFRVDNGKIKWYDLDLPNAIEYRKKILPESERNTYIPKSALDYSWFKNIEFEYEKGIFFIAGGFVYYFKEKEISSLIIEMAKEFPRAEMIFDATSKLANKVINKRAKKAGE
ncbi:MAG: class I SAM-dependent methyltransferase, partial [Promethearchaeota archaeon]